MVKPVGQGVQAFVGSKGLPPADHVAIGHDVQFGPAKPASHSEYAVDWDGLVV